MEKVIKIILSIIFIPIMGIVFFWFGLYLFRVPILRSEKVGALKLLVKLFVPAPQDYVNHIVEAKIDITNKGKTYEFRFHHKYLGKHMIGLLVDEPGENFFRHDDQFSHNLVISASFYVKGKLILTYLSKKKDFNTFYGKLGEGFSLFWYECPKNLPLDEVITCKIKIIHPDDEFYKKYGGVKFFVSKISDL